MEKLKGFLKWVSGTWWFGIVLMVISMYVILNFLAYYGYIVYRIKIWFNENIFQVFG